MAVLIPNHLKINVFDRKNKNPGNGFKGTWLSWPSEDGIDILEKEPYVKI